MIRAAVFDLDGVLVQRKAVRDADILGKRWIVDDPARLRGAVQEMLKKSLED